MATGAIHSAAKLVTALLLKWHLIEEISLSLLLGRDFAVEHGIVVDCLRRRLSIDGRNEDMTASAKGHFSVSLSPERYRELREHFSTGSWLPRKITRHGRWPRQVLATVCYAMAMLQQPKDVAVSTRTS